MLVILSLCSCQQGSADGELTNVSTAIRPTEVTGVRWIADHTVAELDGGQSKCDCSEPSAIARPIGSDDAGCAVVCLGARGFLVARMSASFTNRDGVDLLIYEWGTKQGAANDRFSAYVSENGHEWIPVAESVENDPDRPHASIELGDARGHYLYVKVVAATGSDLSYAKGPEILAIEALHPSIDLGS